MITHFVLLDQTITIYAGDIIDGIYVDGELFGNPGGSPETFTLTDEYVTGITFGYHTHRPGMLFSFMNQTTQFQHK